MIPRLALVLVVLLTLGGCASTTSDKAVRQAIKEHPDMPAVRLAMVLSPLT